MGPQQNAVANDQLESVQSAQLSAAHQQHVQALVEEIAESRADPDEGSQ